MKKRHGSSLESQLEFPWSNLLGALAATSFAAVVVYFFEATPLLLIPGILAILLAVSTAVVRLLIRHTLSQQIQALKNS